MNRQSHQSHYFNQYVNLSAVPAVLNIVSEALNLHLSAPSFSGVADAFTLLAVRV